MKFLVVMCWVSAASGFQTPDAARIEAAMRASTQKQRTSVDAQRASLEKQRSAAEHRQPPAPIQPAPQTPFFLTPPAPPMEQPTAFCSPVPATLQDTLVQQASDASGLPARLLRSVVQQESGFRPCAVSRKGALGLMQLMPATAAELGVADPFEPQQNLAGGARYLKQLLDRYGDLTLALAAYNAGPATVDASGIPQFPETVRYISDVLAGAR